MKLGTVRIDEVISDRVETPSLKAKLYLDRVKNRLLAGLEFHYGNVMINPLEEDGQPSVLIAMRKRKKILDIMSESAFAKRKAVILCIMKKQSITFISHRSNVKGFS